MRKTKLNEAAADRICQAISIGATYEIASLHGGITRATLYNWLKRGKEAKSGQYKTFFDRFAKAEARAALRCLAQINTAAEEGNVQCSQWLLERRHLYRKDTQHESLESIPDISETAKHIPTTENILQTQAAQLRQAIQKAEKSESWQAYAALQRQLLNVSMQLRTIQKEETGNEYSDMQDEQILGEMLDLIANLPPLIQQRLVNDVSELQRQPLRMKK